MEYMNKNKRSILCEGVNWDELFDILRLHYGATLCEDRGIIDGVGGYYCELRVCGTSGRFVSMALLELYEYIQDDDVVIVSDGDLGGVSECIIRIKCRL